MWGNSFRHVCVERMLSSRIICSNYNHEVAHLTLHSLCPVPTGFLSSTSEWQAPWHEDKEVILGKMYLLAWIKHWYPLQTPPPDRFYWLRSRSGWHSVLMEKDRVDSWKQCSMPLAFRGQQLATRSLAMASSQCLRTVGYLLTHWFKKSDRSQTW